MITIVALNHGNNANNHCTIKLTKTMYASYGQ